MARQTPGSRNRIRPTMREHWIAMLVVGISTAFIGIISPLISAVVELPPLLTIFLILVGAAITLLASIRLHRLKGAGGSRVSPHESS